MKESLIRACAGIFILTQLTLYRFVNVNRVWLVVLLVLNYSIFNYKALSN